MIAFSFTDIAIRLLPEMMVKKGPAKVLREITRNNNSLA